MKIYNNCQLKINNKMMKLRIYFKTILINKQKYNNNIKS